MSDSVLGLEVHEWEGPPPPRTRKHLAVYTKPGIQTVGAIVTGQHSDQVTINATSYFSSFANTGTFDGNFRASIGTVGTVSWAGSSYSNQLLVDYKVGKVQQIPVFYNIEDSQFYSPAWMIQYTFVLQEKPS